MSITYHVRRLLLLLVAATFLQHVSGQPVNDTVPDSLPSGFIEKFRELGRRESIKSMETVAANSAARHQRTLLNDIRKTALAAKLYMQSGLDTPGINHELHTIDSDMAVAAEGVLQSPGAFYSLRDLQVSYIILSELSQRMEAKRQELDQHLSELMRFREHIDSLTSNPAILTFPADSQALTRYLSRLRIVAKDVDPTDNALKLAIQNIQDLQTRTDLLQYELNANREQINNLRKALSKNTFRREMPENPDLPKLAPADILKVSWQKDILALAHYLKYNTLLPLLLLLMIMASWRFISVLRSRWRAKQTDNQQLVIHRPLLSAIIIMTCLGQFLFPSPPFLLNIVFWGAPAICLIFIFNHYINAYWLRFWIVTVVLFILASADNLLLQASVPERWAILVLALAGIVWGALHVITPRRTQLRETRIVYFILFMILMELISASFNIAGRYNLAKIFMTSGYFGLVIAILFLWTIRLSNEALTIATAIYKQPDRQLFFINFGRVGDRVPSIFYVILVLGWFVLVARNFYAYSRLSDPFMAFINKQHSIGEYSFSIKGALLFAVILICSMFLSRIISFFASDDASTVPAQDVKKPTLGSWLLLIRIGIISGGLFIAVAAAGIPLDRITIIMGALSVGIGLGLQGLVSNLVSGLILAFEKPVNVGDVIEINGTTGTMKAIGFRSSTIVLTNGAVNVIPNSDILNHQLVNWSLGRRRVRNSLTIGVGYGSDLEKVQRLLTEILHNSAVILKDPAPLAMAKAFGDSAIEFEVFFWVHSLKEMAQAKHDLLLAIDASFKKEGIQIPFPQRDLHIITGNGERQTP